MKKILVILMLFAVGNLFADSKSMSTNKLTESKAKQETYQTYLLDMDAIVLEEQNVTKYREFNSRLHSLEGQIFVQKQNFDKSNNTSDKVRMSETLKQLVNQHSSLVQEFEQWISSL